jgi:hypothetical protein
MTTSVQGGEGDREIQDALSYAVGHRIRVVAEEQIQSWRRSEGE